MGLKINQYNCQVTVYGKFWFELFVFLLQYTKFLLEFIKLTLVYKSKLLHYRFYLVLEDYENESHLDV